MKITANFIRIREVLRQGCFSTLLSPFNVDPFRRTMYMADESSSSDSSNSGAFGCLIFIRKKDGFSVPYDLVPGQITIGSADDADVRIKIPDERLQSHNDMIDVIGKTFEYANENLLNNEVQTEKHVPAKLSSRNRETINIFAEKIPSKSPTFKVKSPSQRRRSVRRSPHKTSDLIVLDTPDRSLSKKPHNGSLVSVTPIVEDVSPATPPNSKETDDVFKTPVNTPALFEDIRKSVLQSRTRKSNRQLVSADIEKDVISKKRGRGSSVGSQRSMKRRRMMYSADNNSEVEVLEESFESFNSEDWAEICQDQTDRGHRFSDLTRTSFAHNPLSKCMSEPRLRQVRSVRLSRQNKTISVNFEKDYDPPANGSFLLANGIREDHLAESPRPSTSNLLMGSGSPAKLKRLQDSPKRNLVSPNNLSKFVGLKQLMRNRTDLSEVFGAYNVTSTPKISKSIDVPSPNKSLSTTTGMRKSRSQTLENEALDLSAVKPPHVEASLTSASRRSTETPVAGGTPAEETESKSKRLTRTPKKFELSDFDLINLSKRSQVDEVDVLETSGQKKLTRPSRQDLMDTTGSRKSTPSARSKQSLQNSTLEMSRSTIDHNYAKSFNSTLQLTDSNWGTVTRRSSRTPIPKQRSDEMVYGTKRTLSVTPKADSSEKIDLDDGASMAIVDDDDFQSIESVSDLDSPQVAISNTSKLSRSSHKFADDDVVYVSGSRRSRSVSRTYNSVETSRRSRRSQIDLSERCVSGNSLRRSSEDQNPVDEDISQASESKNASSANNQYLVDDDTPNSISCVDGDLMRRTRTPNACYNKPSSTPKIANSSGLGSSVANVSRISMRTPGGAEDPGVENASRTSMSTYKRLTKTPGSSRNSMTTSQTLLDEYDVGETSAFRRLTREPDENQTEANSELFAYPPSDSLESSASRRVSKRQSKTPMASFSSWLSASDFNMLETNPSRRASRANAYLNEQNISRSKSSTSLDSSTSKSVTETSSASTALAKTPKQHSTSRILNSSKSSPVEPRSSRMSTRASGGNQSIGDTSTDPRKANSTLKSLDTSTLNTPDPSMSKRASTSSVAKRFSAVSNSFTETLGGNIPPEDQQSNESYSITSTKTPSDEKSFSASQILASDKNHALVPRSSRTTPKSLDSSTLNTHTSRISKRSLSSTVDADSRNSTSSAIKKSALVSRIDSPTRTSEVETDLTLEVDGSESSEPKRASRTPQNVEYKNVMNVSSRSRRQTRTPSGSLYLEDEVLSISMTKLEKECIMTPRDTESYFAFKISPQNDLSNVSGVKRLMKTPRTVKSPKNDLTHVVGIKKLLATPKVARSPKNDLSDIRGVKKLLKTPRTRKSPKNDLTDIRGVKKLLKTPRAPKSPLNDLSNIHGVKKLLQTPKTPKSPKNDLTDIEGVKKLLQTPKAQKSPKNDLTDIEGVKKLLQTPKAQKSPKNDLTDIKGVKKLLQTPKAQKSPKNDLTDIKGVKKLLQTPKAQKSPKNDLTDIRGVKKLLRTPKAPKSPKNDLTNVAGVKKLLSTPKEPKSPKNDLTAIFPLKRLMSTPKPTKEPVNDLSNVSGVKDLFADNQEDLFAAVFNKKRLRTYSGKLSRSGTEELTAIEDDSVVIDSHKDELVEEWVKQQDFVANMEKFDAVDVQTSTKSDNKNRAKRGKAKTSEVEEVSEIPVGLEKKKTKKGQNVEDSTADVTVDIDSHKDELVEEWVKQQDFVANMEKFDEVDVQTSTKSDNKNRAKRGKAKTSEVEEVSEIPVGLEKKKTRKGQNVEDATADHTEKEAGKRTRRKKNQTQEANIVENNSGTIEGQKQEKQSVKPASSSKEKKTNEIEENETVVVEQPIRTTRGRKKIIQEANSDETDRKTEPKKHVAPEEIDMEVSAIKEKPTRKGRRRKDETIRNSEDTETSERPTRKGTKGQAVEAEEQQSTTVLKNNEAGIQESKKEEEIATAQTTDVQPRRVRNKVVDNVEEETEVRGTAVRRGRNKKAVEAVQEVQSKDVKEPPKRLRNKKVVEEIKEEDQKRTRRARAGAYDKYGGEFLSESPLNTKRIRGKK
nr:unnamed protein product [Callosobruchus analis]